MKKSLKLFVFLLIILLFSLLVTNIYVIQKGGEKILASAVRTDELLLEEELEELEKAGIDVVLVLGAGLNIYGRPSQVLQDRLDVAVFLYEKGIVNKVLLSGDNGDNTYNEVTPMYEYVLEQGVEKEDIFLDYAGFSTYESIYRAKAIFEVEEMIISTQKFHQYRAGYIAKSLGIEAIGIGANQSALGTDWKMEFRESLARIKDFFYCIFKPEPTYLGEIIPIDGSGEITHMEI